MDKRTKERQLLSRLAREASEEAYRESLAMGLTVRIAKNGKMMDKFPDGSTKVVKTLERIKSKIPLKKGMVLCLKPKD